jgi:hypothetical protein
MKFRKGFDEMTTAVITKLFSYFLNFHVRLFYQYLLGFMHTNLGNVPRKRDAASFAEKCAQLIRRNIELCC